MTHFSDLSAPSDSSDQSDLSDPSDLSDLSDPSDLSDLSDPSDLSDLSDSSDCQTRPAECKKERRDRTRMCLISPLKKTAATYSPCVQVPSALLGLTSLFGMVRGGSPTL